MKTAKPDLSRGALLAEAKSPSPPYTAKEVAHLLNVSLPQVYRQCETGALGHIRVGRSVRIPRAALEAYLARHSVGIGPAA